SSRQVQTMFRRLHYGERFSDCGSAIAPIACCQSKYQHTTHSHDVAHSVIITRAHHPFQGRSLLVMGQTHRHNRLQLLLVLPDGSRSLIPADWTDFRRNDQTGTTDDGRPVAVASLSDLLQVRRIIDA